MNRLCHVEIDERGLARPTPEIEQERRVAIFDLLEDNSFALPIREDRPVPPAPIVWALPSARTGWFSTSPTRGRPRWASFTSRSGRSGRW